MKTYVWCEPVRHRLLGMVLMHEEFGGSQPVWPGAEVGLPFSTRKLCLGASHLNEEGEHWGAGQVGALELSPDTISCGDTDT